MSTAAKIGIAIGASAIVAAIVYFVVSSKPAAVGPPQIVPASPPGGNPLATIADITKSLPSAVNSVSGLVSGFTGAFGGDSSGDNSATDGSTD
jgi:hypothetical protein